MEISEIRVVELLHTERLTERYGRIHIVVLKHEDGNLRLSELIDENGILRTMAITNFSEIPYSDSLQAIHNAVKNGSSIGQTIRDFGCEIAKKNVANFIIEAPVFFKNSGKYSTCFLSKIYCVKDDIYEYYGEVCEINCPSFSLLDSLIEYESKNTIEKIKKVLSKGNVYPKNIFLIK